MSFKRIKKWQFVTCFLRRLAEWRVQEKLAEIVPRLEPSDKVLDVGSGNCVILHELGLRNYQVSGIDVDNLSFIEGVQPVVYNGVQMPFGDQSFDVSLLITVLHHIPKPEATLAEARRISKRIVVIEEIYSNSIEKYLTYFIDSLFNFEFFGHPRSNKTDEGWKAAFEGLGLRLVDAKYSRSALVLKRATYVLEVA